MKDLISRKDLLDLLNKSISETDGDTPIVDSVLITVKHAVELMPTIEPPQNLFCPSCKWREWAATHLGEIKDE